MPIQIVRNDITKIHLAQQIDVFHRLCRYSVLLYPSYSAKRK